MEFMWDDWSLDIPPGAMICGIHHRFQRPFKVALSYDDLKELNAMPRERRVKYLYFLQCALKKGSL